MNRFPKFNPNKILGIILLLGIAFSVIRIVMAVAPNPGHNFTEVSGSVATGNLLYGSATDVLSALASVAAGSYLRSAGVSTAPVWSTLTLPNSAAVGDILYSSATNVIGNLADVAVGRFLVSGGVGVTPLYSATPTLGVAGATLGTLSLAGNTSGVVTIQPQAAAGTYNFNLPTGAGTAGQPLLSGGGVGAAMTFGTLTVGAGGTGLAATADDAVWVGDSASAVTARTLPSCSGATTDKLLYNISTNSFSCGADQTAAGGPTILGADLESLSSTVYTTIFTIALTINRTNIIEAYLAQSASAATIGIQTRGRVTASAHTGYCKFRRLSAATADANLDNILVSTAPADTAQTAELDTNVASTEVICTVLTEGTAGNLVLEFQSETGGSVKTRGGSYFTKTVAP